MKMVTRNSRNRILRKSRGAITIFEMIPIIALIGGICCGVKISSHFGQAGAWAGGFIGGILGLVCWRFTLVFLSKWLDRNQNLSNRTTEGLNEMLHNPKCKNPNLVLLELGMRGEKMENYLPVIWGLLVSPLIETRKRGWYTLVSVFPEHAKTITDYHYGDPVEKCREKVQKLVPFQI
jgi:hypothetical protein